LDCSQLKSFPVTAELWKGNILFAMLQIVIVEGLNVVLTENFATQKSFQKPVGCTKN
jgi:hypothetical protein